MKSLSHLLVAAPVVVEALVDVVAALLLAAHQLQPQAGVVREVDDIQPEVAGLDRLKEDLLKNGQFQYSTVQS